ncbi:Type I HSP40 co-chaperone [Coemansia sp. IMI 203386]|nr:Type I HSP40 co-chaperone [Coemansia sp. IMI 203386]
MTDKSVKEPQFYLYKTLGVPNSASKQEIVEAYKQHIVKHHPDNYPHASDIIKAVQHAYEVLSNQKTRNIYDSFCRNILYHSLSDDSDEDESASADYEIGPIVYPKPSWVVQKNDIVYVMDMSLRNIYTGKKSTVVTKEASVEVDIKKGAKDGQRITYKGKGKVPRNGPSGDLIVIINRAEYPFFEKRQHDIYCKIEVGHKIATEGAELCIRHPSGKILCVRLDPGEIHREPSMQKVLKNKGLESKDSKKTGDMHIEFQLYFPYANITI